MYGNDEWQVMALSHHPQNLMSFNMEERENGKWIRKVEPRRHLGFDVYIKLRRHPAYYLFNIIIPLLVISVANICTAFIPAAADRRVGMSITVLLAFTFLQNLVATNTPKSSRWPLLCRYILGELVLSGFNVAGCVTIMTLFKFPEGRPPPRLIVLLGAWLPHILKRQLRYSLIRCINVFRRCFRVEPLKIRLSQRRGSAAMPYSPNETPMPNIFTHNVQRMSPEYHYASSDLVDESWQAVAVNLNYPFLILFFTLQALLFYFYFGPILRAWYSSVYTVGDNYFTDN